MFWLGLIAGIALVGFISFGRSLFRDMTEDERKTAGKIIWILTWAIPLAVGITYVISWHMSYRASL